LSGQTPPITDISIDTTGNAASSTDMPTLDKKSDGASSGTVKTKNPEGKRSEDPFKERLNEIISSKEDRGVKAASFIQSLAVDKLFDVKEQTSLKALSSALSDFSFKDQESLFVVFDDLDFDENEWIKFITYSLLLASIKSKSVDEDERSNEMYELVEELAYENPDKKVLTLALKSMTDEVRSIVTEALASLDPNELDSDQEEWKYFIDFSLRLLLISSSTEEDRSDRFKSLYLRMKQSQSKLEEAPLEQALESLPKEDLSKIGSSFQALNS